MKWKTSKMIPMNFNTMRERSEAHVALCKALSSKDCAPQEAVAREAFADLIVHPDLDVNRVLYLSNRLLVDRNIATPLDVIFDIPNLSEFYNVTASEMIIAARLCGAVRIRRGQRYLWADSDAASFVLDDAALADANANLAGR